MAFAIFLFFFLSFLTEPGKSDTQEEYHEKCLDRLPKDVCATAVENGMCMKAHTVMKQRCPRTCGFCGPLCRDVFGWYCSRWKYHSVCRTHRSRMKEWCRETCGFCKAHAPASCFFSKYGCCWNQKTPAKGPNYKGCGGCYDRLVLCSSFHDDCFFYRNKDFMAQNCPYTCGLCQKQHSYYVEGKK